MNPTALELLENIWIHNFSILDIDLQLPLRNIHLSKLLFPQQETSSNQTYRRTINPINLQSPTQEVFYAFLNKVKEQNVTLENPK